MSEHAAVLFANDAFYLAFAGRDARAMAAAWSGRETITCIHPGWPPLIGREEVMQSWRAILGNPSSPPVSCRKAVARLLGEVAWVVCHEEVSGTFLVATNLFVREGGRWRLVHHQAGAAPPPEPDPQATPAPLQ